MKFYFKYTVGHQEKILEVNAKDTSVVLEKSWLNYWGPDSNYRVCGWQRMTGYTDDFYVQIARYGGDCYAPWSYLNIRTASQNVATALSNAGVPDWTDATYQLVLEDMTHEFLNAQDIADNDIHSYSYQVLKIGNTGSCKFNFAKKTVYEQSTPVTKFANKAFAGFDPYHNDGSVTGFITYPDQTQSAIVYDSTLREPNLYFAVVKVHDDEQNSPHYNETVDVVVIFRSVYMDGYTPPVGSEICFVDARLFDVVEPKVEPTKSTTRGNTPNGFRGDRNDGSDSDTESHIGLGFREMFSGGEHGVRVKQLDHDQVQVFYNCLWQQDLWENFQQWKWNPIGCVLSLQLMPCEPEYVATNASNIKLGGYEMKYENSGLTVYSQGKSCANYREIRTKIFHPEEYSGSFLDWGNNTSISFRLPFIGVVPIDTSKVMNGGIFAKYNIDFYTGNCLAQIYTIPEKSVMGTDGDWDETYGGCLCMIAQYAGNCAHKIAVSGNDYGAGQVVGAIVDGVSSAASIVTGIAAARHVPAFFGQKGMMAHSIASGVNGIVGAIGSGFMSRHNISVIPASPNADTLGMMIPALIIERPIDITPLSPDNKATVYGEFAGRPAASGGTVKDYSELGDGNIFVQGIIHADVLYATESEKQEIEQGFAKGMYV